jgi:hypothetical protein
MLYIWKETVNYNIFMQNRIIVNYTRSSTGVIVHLLSYSTGMRELPSCWLFDQLNSQVVSDIKGSPENVRCQINKISYWDSSWLSHIGHVWATSIENLLTRPFSTLWIVINHKRVHYRRIELCGEAKVFCSTWPATRFKCITPDILQFKGRKYLKMRWVGKLAIFKH